MNCKKCTWWEAGYRTQHSGARAARDSGWGDCLRHAPRQPTDDGGAFPRTFHEDRCGDFTTKSVLTSREPPSSEPTNRADAKAAAMEAAGDAFFRNYDTFKGASASFEAGIAAYLAHMAAAGWVMVQDVGEMDLELLQKTSLAALEARGHRDVAGRILGWNACRAAFLKGKG